MELALGIVRRQRSVHPARKLYFDRFRQLLFGATQVSLLDWLHKLPSKPGPNDQYRPTYDTLKAYLITTSHHEKSTRAFLSPLLYERWAAGRQIDPDRAELARRQFDFYSDELLLANPYSSANDGEAVEWARSYLAQFNAVESIYQFILAEATRQKPSINFNRQFKGSGAYVVNGHEVSGGVFGGRLEIRGRCHQQHPAFLRRRRMGAGPHALANVDPEAHRPAVARPVSPGFHRQLARLPGGHASGAVPECGRCGAEAGAVIEQPIVLTGTLCLASVNIESRDAGGEAILTSRCNMSRPRKRVWTAISGTTTRAMRTPW